MPQSVPPCLFYSFHGFGGTGVCHASCKERRPKHEETKRHTHKRIAAAARNLRADIATAAPPLPEHQAVSLPEEPTTEHRETKTQHHTSSREERSKRGAIEWAYFQLDEPPESEWGSKGGTVVRIREYLRLPNRWSSHSEVIWRTLRAINGQEGDRGRGGGYDGMKEAVLTQQEALVVASAITTGCGQVQATHQLNAWRKKKGLSPISRKSVRTVLAGLGVLRFRCCPRQENWQQRPNERMVDGTEGAGAAVVGDNVSGPIQVGHPGRAVSHYGACVADLTHTQEIVRDLMRFPIDCPWPDPRV